MTPPRAAAFAIPGDPSQRTGGFIYERRVLEELRAAGRDVLHLRLPAGFPDPSPADTAAAAGLLRAVPPDRPLILDGLVFGAIETAVLRSLRAPVVAMVHHPLGLETGLPPARAAALLSREAENLRHAARVVVPSAHTARVLAADLGADPARITVAPPGHDGPRGLPREEADPPLILAVGLLARRKGHDVLLRALAGVADLSWTAAIVGKGFDAGYEAELRALLPALGLEARATLRGEVGDAELDGLYRSAGAFALATRYEGYGMALAEALAWGLPVVASAAGAVPDTVGDAALLVPPDDVGALAAALRRVLSDAALRAGLAARARARGLALPRWSDTAAVMGGVLDGL